MKKTTYLLSVFCLAIMKLAPAATAAPLVLPPADVFYTSFEETDSPPYAAGALGGQNGWSLKGSTVNASTQVIVGGAGGAPSSPDGAQMVALRNAKNSQDVYAGSPKVALQFAPTGYTDSLNFSGLTAFSGAISASTGVISRFYLNDTNEFNGVIFGLHKDGDDVRFFYNNGNTAVSFGDVSASAETFYRFEVNVDIAARKFDIRVYDYGTNLLLGSSENAVFRGNTTSLNYLRFNNLSNPPTNGDDFVTYYDEIWIGTQAIPEPSTWALLIGCASFLLPGARRLLPPVRR